MGEGTVVARGPIAPVPPVTVEHGWEIGAPRGLAALRITDCSPLAKVMVKADVDGRVARALGVAFGRSARDEHGSLVVGCGPGEWLLLAPPGAAAALVEWAGTIPDEGLVSVLDETHGRALVRITGAATSATLAKICAIDLADRVTPNRSAFRTSVAGVVADVVREDLEVERSYLVGCERSFGQYLFDRILDAGEEFAMEIDGFVFPEVRESET